MTSISAQLLTISIISLQRQAYHNRNLNRTTWNEQYDFVVVGGGTAGCVVANRLSANPNISVLLIESGPPLTVTSDIMPSLYYFNNIYNYRTVPQENSGFAIENRQIMQPRGRILGGSGGVNFALYTRGNRRDYDAWAYYYGATGWSYNEVLPYFLMSENNTDPYVVNENPAYHSTRGPLQVSTVPELDPIYGLWEEAAVKMGYPKTDFNGPEQFGTSKLDQI